MKLYNYKHELLAYLDDVNPSLEKILGGISTLSFVFYKDKYDNENGLMREDERYKYVVNEAVVEYDGEFFVIKNSTPIHDEYGVIYKEVSCKHMSVELSGTKIDGLWGFSPTVESFESPYNRPTTIYNAFSDLLKNHTNGWELGIIPDSEKRRTFEFEWVTPMQVIVDLSQVYGYTPHFRTEYKYGKICKYVDLLTDDYGEIKGYYRHESTLKSIRKPITSEGITTRLYVFGYNDITLNDIPTESRTINGTSYNIHEKGKSYIDNFDYYLKQGYTYEECLKYFIKTDVVRDDLYVDPEDLYTFGKEHIEKVAMPNVSYTVVITDIDFIGKPEIEIGHKIRIYDDEMNVDLVGRVSKISFSNDDKENKLIEISNYYTLLEEIDLLTDMVIKQNTLQTRAIKRYSKFANSIVINDSTGIIVQSDRQDLINPNSRMAEDHIPYYRDVVRIGEYEYGKYGIQILDGELQMDRYDNKTRVLINNDDGFVMYRDKDGNGEFGDNERVFWVDYDGIAHANGFTITNSDIFVGEGETIMDRFDTVTETIDGVKETTTNLSTVVNQTAEQVSLKANKTEVSELRGVVDGYEERIQQAELKVTADAIISTVSETIETAKTEAINTSSQYVDGQLVNYYTKTESDSKIEQTASSVAIEVANTQINNLQIGGANLLLNSDEKKELNRAEPNTYNHISYNLVDDYKNLTLSEDTTFVLSFTSDRNGNFDKECFDSITFDDGWYQRWSREDIDKITYIKDSTFKFVMKPKTLPKGTPLADKLTFIAEFEYGGGLFYDVMLVEGNKATDYTPSFTDINNSIAKMEIKADEIASTVARQEVQNMEIGGTNLIGQTTQTQGYGVEVVEVTETGWTVRGSQDRDNAVFRFLNVLDRNGWYTFSFDGKFNGNSFRTYVEANDQRVGTVNLTSEWQHFSFTFEVTNYDFDNTGVYTFIEFQRLGNELYYFKNVKLEHGKIETDYSPCPRDYSTTTQMNSAIQQKADSITSSVSKTYATKNDVNSNFATKSELTQTSNAFTLQFSEQANGDNLVHNGNFSGGDSGWLRSGDLHFYTGILPNINNGALLGSNTGGGFYSNKFKIKYGQTYTFALDMKVESNVSNAYCVLECFDGNNAYRGEIFNRRINNGHNGRLHYHHTMTTCNGVTVGSDWTARVKIWHSGSTVAYNGYLIVVHNICVTEGRNSAVYVGSSSGTFEGITHIDKDGVKVTHSADGSYSHMSASGFKYYDAHANWSYHSLMKQGWLGDISGTSWSRTITLPPSFRNKVFSVIISIEMVNAVNTHDVIKHYKVTVPQNTVNYANGTFVINMSALAYYVPGQGSATAITTNVSWIAIA